MGRGAKECEFVRDVEVKTKVEGSNVTEKGSKSISSFWAETSIRRVIQPCLRKKFH